MPEWESMVLVGIVARPHGIRGQVVVNPETDFVAERFRTGAAVWTRFGDREERLTMVDARLQGRRPVVAFEGFRTVEDAERLSGQELRIPEEALQPLPAGSYYLHQLVGCGVETVDGARLGEVVRVDGGMGGAVLAVAGQRGEILIPLVVDICVAVDIGARAIRVQVPEGLLEINETKERRGEPGARRANEVERPPDR